MTPHRRPLHERIPPLGWLRGKLRAGLFGFLRKVAGTEDGRVIATETLAGMLRPPPVVPNLLAPYPELGRPREAPCKRSDVIIITARFRSGSTLLWNLFRRLDGFTAYYEPLNERRWFDPAARGNRVDPTHRNVEDYWREFEGLDELGPLYDEAWTTRHLFMDESFWEPRLRRYFEVLIERAKGRPVLQKNRMDFRLGWVRRNFPNAKIIHLYRHPRDQWCSALMDPNCFPPDGKTSEFHVVDRFYLLAWARDLKYQFPFLDERTVEHPYQLHYFIWKLSYLFGRRYADHSLGFEDLVTDPETELDRLFEAVDVAATRHEVAKLREVIVRPALGKWKEYAPDAWFARHESHCETVLADFLETSTADRVRPVTAITNEYDA